MNQRYLETVGCLHFPACREYVEIRLHIHMNRPQIGQPMGNHRVPELTLTRCYPTCTKTTLVQVITPH